MLLINTKFFPGGVCQSNETSKALIFFVNQSCFGKPKITTTLSSPNLSFEVGGCAYVQHPSQVETLKYF